MANDIDRALDALNHLDAGCARDEWVLAGMAAHSAGLSFDDFHDWSENGDNYIGVIDCSTAWESFDASKAVTVATLFWMAREQGWQDPSKGTRESRPSLPPTKVKQTSPKAVIQAANSKAVEVWDRCIPASLAHAYIDRKQGSLDGLRVYPDSAPPLVIGKQNQNVAGYLAVPCWSGEHLQTLQFIPPDKGDKLNLAGAKFNDGFFAVGEII